MLPVLITGFVFMCFYMCLLIFVLVCFWFLHKPDVCLCLCVLLVLWSQSGSQYRTSFSSVPASFGSGTYMYVNINVFSGPCVPILMYKCVCKCAPSLVIVHLRDMDIPLVCLLLRYSLLLMPLALYFSFVHPRREQWRILFLQASVSSMKFY